MCVIKYNVQRNKKNVLQFLFQKYCVNIVLCLITIEVQA
jgi:hypothetical protein